VHLVEQALGIGSPQGLGPGDAGVEQQGGLLGPQLEIPHQASLGPQAPQAGLTGLAPSGKLAQGAIPDLGQGPPIADAGGPQHLHLSAELMRHHPKARLAAAPPHGTRVIV